MLKDCKLFSSYHTYPCSITLRILQVIHTSVSGSCPYTISPICMQCRSGPRFSMLHTVKNRGLHVYIPFVPRACMGKRAWYQKSQLCVMITWVEDQQSKVPCLKKASFCRPCATFTSCHSLWCVRIMAYYIQECLLIVGNERPQNLGDLDAPHLLVLKIYYSLKAKGGTTITELVVVWRLCSVCTSVINQLFCYSGTARSRKMAVGLYVLFMRYIMHVAFDIRFTCFIAYDIGKAGKIKDLRIRLLVPA